MIMTGPQVKRAMANKVSRARTTAMAPTPLSILETTIILKPKMEWRPGPRNGCNPWP